VNSPSGHRHRGRGERGYPSLWNHRRRGGIRWGYVIDQRAVVRWWVRFVNWFGACNTLYYIRLWPALWEAACISTKSPRERSDLAHGANLAASFRSKSYMLKWPGLTASNHYQFLASAMQP